MWSYCPHGRVKLGVRSFLKIAKNDTRTRSRNGWLWPYNRTKIRTGIDKNVKIRGPIQEPGLYQRPEWNTFTISLESRTFGKVSATKTFLYQFYVILQTVPHASLSVTQLTDQQSFSSFCCFRKCQLRSSRYTAKNSAAFSFFSTSSSLKLILSWDGSTHNLWSFNAHFIFFVQFWKFAIVNLSKSTFGAWTLDLLAHFISSTSWRSQTVFSSQFLAFFD